MECSRRASSGQCDQLAVPRARRRSAAACAACCRVDSRQDRPAAGAAHQGREVGVAAGKRRSVKTLAGGRDITFRHSRRWLDSSAHRWRSARHGFVQCIAHRIAESPDVGMGFRSAEIFGIPRRAMPRIAASSGSFGICKAIPGMEGVPILAAIGDSHAAMFGHGRYAPGTVKATYGTGSSLMALTPGLAADTPTLARTIAWSIGGEDTVRAGRQHCDDGLSRAMGRRISWTCRSCA